MQSLDVAFMKLLKAYYSAAFELWLDQHPGCVVTHYQVARLFTQAYEKAAPMTVARNGFQKTGILPYDP